MYRFPLENFKLLPERLGFSGVDELCQRWGRNRAVWYRTVGRGAMHLRDLVDLANTFRLNVITLLPEEDATDTQVCLEKDGIVNTCEGKMTWRDILVGCDWTLTRALRALRTDGRNITTDDMQQVCERWGISGEAFFAKEPLIVSTSNRLVEPSNNRLVEPSNTRPVEKPTDRELQNNNEQPDVDLAARIDFLMSELAELKQIVTNRYNP